MIIFLRKYEHFLDQFYSLKLSTVRGQFYLDLAPISNMSAPIGTRPKFTSIENIYRIEILNAVGSWNVVNYGIDFGLRSRVDQHQTLIGGNFLILDNDLNLKNGCKYNRSVVK